MYTFTMILLLMVNSIDLMRIITTIIRERIYNFDYYQRKINRAIDEMDCEETATDCGILLTIAEWRPEDFHSATIADSDTTLMAYSLTDDRFYFSRANLYAAYKERQWSEKQIALHLRAVEAHERQHRLDREYLLSEKDVEKYQYRLSEIRAERAAWNFVRKELGL